MRLELQTFEREKVSLWHITAAILLLIIPSVLIG
jgi:hypothetical protein